MATCPLLTIARVMLEPTTKALSLEEIEIGCIEEECALWRIRYIADGTLSPIEKGGCGLINRSK